MGGPAGAAAQASTNLPGVGTNGGLPDELEKGPMSELYKTYGKVIHTWHPTTSALPLGPPTLMMSTTEKHPGARENVDLIASRKKEMGIDTNAKEEYRKSYLDPNYQVAQGADEWEKTGKAKVFEVKEMAFKNEDGSMSQAGGAK